MRFRTGGRGSLSLRERVHVSRSSRGGGTQVRWTSDRGTAARGSLLIPTPRARGGRVSGRSRSSRSVLVPSLTWPTSRAVMESCSSARRSDRRRLAAVTNHRNRDLFSLRFFLAFFRLFISLFRLSNLGLFGVSFKHVRGEKQTKNEPLVAAQFRVDPAERELAEVDISTMSVTPM